MTEDA